MTLAQQRTDRSFQECAGNVCQAPYFAAWWAGLASAEWARARYSKLAVRRDDSNTGGYPRPFNLECVLGWRVLFKDFDEAGAVNFRACTPKMSACAED